MFDQEIVNIPEKLQDGGGREISMSNNHNQRQEKKKGIRLAWYLKQNGNSHHETFTLSIIEIVVYVYSNFW